MASFSSRFLSSHRYVSDLFEDVFTYTLCLPFTLSLVLSVHTAAGISDLVSENNQIDQWFWKISKVIFLMPVMILKGLVQVSIAPLLALLLAIRSQPLSKYSFKLTQIFEKYQFKAKLPLYLLLIVFNPILAIALIPFIVMCTKLFKQLLKHKKIIKEPSPQEFILSIMPALLLYNFMIVKITFTLMLPIYSQLLLPFSLPLVCFLGTVGWLIAKSSFDVSLANALDYMIVKAQNTLFKFGINPFKNAKDISLSSVTEIPQDNLFISNSNHAFNLAELELNVVHQGFRNYYITDHNASLDKNDILRLERQSSIHKFPSLKKFIGDNKNSLTTAIVTSESLKQLDIFAKVLGTSQEDSPDFTITLLQAQQNLDKYLDEKVSPSEKAAILKLNLLGGTDPDNQFTHVINTVFTGVKCKKNVSGLISNTIERIKNEEDVANYQPFWHGKNMRDLM